MMRTKNLKSRSLAAILAVLFLFGMGKLGVLAGESFSWYCKHVKGHMQPSADASLAFVEELNGFYIDHNHTSVEENDKVIYLTFDVGYENGNVAKVLDTLLEKNVSGAFFVLGNVIQKESDLIKRMVAEGHTVGNHTVHHKNMCNASESELLQELKHLEDMYLELTGKEMAPYYRPPEGRFSRQNLECLSQNGYRTVFWSFAYPDWNNEKQMPPEKAKQIILENVHNGEVMLLHPTSAVNAAILGEVIDVLQAEGYRFGTLDELTGSGTYAR